MKLQKPSGTEQSNLHTLFLDHTITFQAGVKTIPTLLRQYIVLWRLTDYHICIVCKNQDLKLTLASKDVFHHIH